MSIITIINGWTKTLFGAYTFNKGNHEFAVALIANSKDSEDYVVKLIHIDLKEYEEQNIENAVASWRIKHPSDEILACYFAYQKEDNIEGIYTNDFSNCRIYIEGRIRGFRERFDV